MKSPKSQVHVNGKIKSMHRLLLIILCLATSSYGYSQQPADIYAGLDTSLTQYYPNVGALSKPDYLDTAIDPDFGTTIRRIVGDPGTSINYSDSAANHTWSSTARQGYNLRQAWNADQSVMRLEKQNVVLLDGNTYVPIKPMPSTSGAAEVRWHPTDPDLFLLLKDDGVYTMNWETGTHTKLGSGWSGYSGCSLGYSGNWSDDGNRIACYATRTSDGKTVGFAYDSSTDNKSADIDLSTMNGSIDDMGMSATGDYIHANGDFVNAYDETRLWTWDGADGSAPVLHDTWINASAGQGEPSHNDMCQWNGEDYAVGTDKGNSGIIIARKFSDGTKTNLITGGWAIHTSCRNINKQGYALSSIGAETGGYLPYYDELVITRLDGGNPYRVASIRKSLGGYDNETQPIFSPNGDKIVFATDWGSGGLPIQAYVIDLDGSEPPIVSAGEDQFICEGDSATLTASGGNNFLWSTGETTQSITVSPDQTTTYTVTGTDSEGNESTDSVTVTVNAIPNANAGSDEEVCENDSITLNASGGDSYDWSNGQTTQSITVSPNETTAYTVTVTTNGCSATDDVTVTVNPRPVVNAGNDVDIYQNESITLTASGDGTFNWNTGEETQSITVSPIDTTTYTVTANLNGCSSSDSVTVTVLEPETVTANAGEDEFICENESVTLTASGGPNYLWNTQETTQSIEVSPTATTTYTVTVFNDFNSDTDDVTVTVNALPTANAGSDEEVCLDEGITLTASGGDFYEWSSGQTTQSITVNPDDTTTYTVTVTTNGCSDSDDVTVTVNPRPSVNAGNDVDIYQNESITLTASGDGTFNWNTGEETQSITVSPAETTIYTVTANLNGCSSSDSVTVTVLEADTVNANAGEDKSICENESVTLTASGGPNYLWSTLETTQSITVSPLVTTTYSVTVFNDFNSDTDDVVVNVNPYPTANAGDDRAILSGDTITLSASGGSEFIWSTGETTQEIVVEPQETTAYTVEVIENGCSDIASVTVVVGVSASVGGEPTICQGQSTTLYAAGGSYFQWSTGETTQSIEVSPTQTTTYSVVVSNNTSSDEAQITVNVNLVPAADAGEDVTIESGQNVTLTASGGNSYLWSNGETTQSISVSPTDTTTYTVDSIINGCSNSDDVMVSVVQQVNASAGEDMQICLGESTELTATGGLYFTWDTGVESASIEVSPLETTVYRVTVSNGISEQTAEVMVSVEDCSAIEVEPENFESEFTVYPNPTDGQVNVRLAGIENISSIYVSDLTGKVISSETFEANDGYVINKQYDFSSLSKGIYLITFKQIGEVAITKKLIVK